MSALTFAPWAATVAALGVLGLLTARSDAVRIGATVALLAGSAPLVLLRLSELGYAVAARPLLGAGAVLAAALLLAAGAALFTRAPWLIVVLALVASLRIPL